MSGWVSLRTSAVVAFAAMILLSACGSESPGEVVDANSQSIADALSEAQEMGASEAQIHLLEEALDSGQMSLESARSATRRTVECITSAGSFAEYDEETINGGRILPGYIWETSAAALNEECEKRESYWVNYLYQTQSSSLQEDAEFFEQQRPILLSCLQENGLDPDPDGDIYDLLRMAAELQASGTGTSGNCLEQADIDGF